MFSANSEGEVHILSGINLRHNNQQFQYIVRSDEEYATRCEGVIAILAEIFRKPNPTSYSEMISNDRTSPFPQTHSPTRFLSTLKPPSLPQYGYLRYAYCGHL